MPKTEIRRGLGGQGVILCGSISARPRPSTGASTTMIRPRARAGSACRAQGIISDETIGYRYGKNPDILVLMAADAYKLFAPTVKPGGLILFESDLVHPDKNLPAGTRTVGIPATRFAEELGRRLVLNIVMVGFFAGTTGILSYEAMEKAVLDSVPKGTEDLNARALKKGYEFGRSLAACGGGTSSR